MNLAILLIAASAGCRSLSRQGPVPRALSNCRQLSQQGINAIERGQWDRAEVLLSQAVDACPVDADARRHYAETLFHRGAVAEAIAQLEEAGHINSDDASLAVRTGEMHLAANQTRQALELADQALGLDPRLASAWALHGRAYQALGRVRLALADYQRALGYAPDNRDLLLNVAEAHRLLDDPERALAALQTLSDTYPPGEEPQQVLYLEGLALAQQGRASDALARYARALECEKPTAEILYRMAQAQASLGNHSSAQTAAMQALQLDPGHAASRAMIEQTASGPTLPRR